MFEMIAFPLCLIAGIFCGVKGKQNNNAILLAAGIGIAAIGAIILFKSFFAALGILIAAGGVFGLLTAGSRSKMNAYICIGVVVLGLIPIYLTQFGEQTSSAQEEALERADILARAQGEVLGAFVQKNYSGKTVAVLLPAGKENNKLCKALIAGFAAGLGKEPDKTVVRPAMDMNSDVPPMEQSKIYDSAESFDTLFESVGCDVILNFAGLPVDESETAACATLESDKIILILPENYSNYPDRIVDAVKSGNVGALVIQKVDPIGASEDLPSGSQQIFDSKYILLTQGNIDDYLSNPAYMLKLNPMAE